MKRYIKYGLYPFIGLLILASACQPRGMIPVTGNEEPPEPISYPTEAPALSPESVITPTEEILPQPTETQVFSPTEQNSLQTPESLPTITQSSDLPSFETITETPTIELLSSGESLQNLGMTLLWTADFETGNLKQYDGVGGFIRRNPTDTYAITNAIAHQGSYAVALTIDTTKPSPSGGYAAYLFLWNQNLLAGDNYYSAWYYIPQGVVTRDWWNMWQWKSTDDGNSDHSVPMFCLDVVQGSGGLDIRLFYRPDLEFPQKKGFTQSIKKVPTNRWFHLEGYYRRGQNNDGQVIVWLDGTEIFNVSGYPTVLRDNTLYWSVNNYTDFIQPNPYSIYIDDVALSKVRLGPAILNTTLSSQVVALNQPVGSVIGELQTTNSKDDQNTVYSYRLVEGNGGEDNSLFQINQNQLLTNSVFLPQGQPSFNILVETQDNLGHKIYTPFVLDILPLPQSPVLIAPQGKITNTRQPVFQWRAVNNASGYFLHIYRSSTFSPLEQEVTPFCENGVCSYSLPFPLTNATYQFRVKAKNLSGWGDFGAWKVFTIQYQGGKLTSPAIIGPSGQINTDIPQYSWREVEGAVGYTLSLYDFAQRKVLWENSVAAQCLQGVCTYTQPTPLSAGLYGVKAKAVGENGNDSSYSRMVNFTVKPQRMPVTLISPNSMVNTNRPTFVWQAVSGATRYYLLVYQANNGRFPIRSVITPITAGCSSGNGQCRLVAPKSLSNGQYLFKVRAFTNNGWGPYSEYMSFTVSQ